jgi:signal transduction histidine kinase
VFSGLRLRLTLLYLLTALALLVIGGAGSYQLIANYFERTTDLALQHKMAHEFTLLRAPVPSALATADRDWSIERSDRNGSSNPGDNDEPWERYENVPPTSFQARASDGELAAIFVLPLDASGQLLFDPNPFLLPTAPDTDAVRAALRMGSDLRTITTEDGERIRLLTYRLTRDDGPAVLQLGRTLGDQDRVLAQLLTILSIIGVASTVILGIGSWWLAGRALHPAQFAWERQQTFLSNASHELRTPLTLVRANAEVALRELPFRSADERELVTDLIESTDHMTRLVDDLLLLSRLDAGRLKVECRPLAVADLLGDVSRQAGRLAEQRGIALVVERLEGAVQADPTRLRQVLFILIDNALRHTSAGGTIILKVLPAPGEPAMIDFSVADTGSGIDPNHLPYVFERFYRDEHSRSSGGSGLGLSIAHALVQAQGGTIRIESTPGVGTMVLFRLPRAAVTIQ